MKPIEIKDIKKGDVIIEHERGGYLRSCKSVALCDAFEVNDKQETGWKVKAEFISGDHPMMDGNEINYFADYKWDGTYGPCLYLVARP